MMIKMMMIIIVIMISIMIIMKKIGIVKIYMNK